MLPSKEQIEEVLREILFRNKIQMKWHCVKCQQEFLYADIDTGKTIFDIEKLFQEYLSGHIGEMMSEGGIANLIPLNWRKLSLQDLARALYGHIPAHNNLSRKELIELIVETEATSDTRMWDKEVGHTREQIKEARDNNFKRIGEIADAILSSGKEVCPECHATGYDLQCKVCSGEGTIKKGVK